MTGAEAINAVRVAGYEDFADISKNGNFLLLMNAACDTVAYPLTEEGVSRAVKDFGREAAQ